MASAETTPDNYDYLWEDGMEKKVKTFRQRGTSGDAMLFEIDHEQNIIRVVDSMKGTTYAKLAECLEDEPRYVLYIHTVTAADGVVKV